MFDKYVVKEIEDLVSENKALFESLHSKRVFVTGATGLIGSQIVLALLIANKKYGFKIEITIFVRSLLKARTVFGDDIKALQAIEGDIRDKITVEDTIDYIIHGASATDSLDFVQKPVDTIYTVVDGTRNVLELAKLKDISGFVFLSSLEVYGAFENQKDVSENDFGYLNPANARSSYSEGKRLAESLCIAYATQYYLPVKIARLSQTFGPGVNYQDNRVFAQFVRSVIEKRDIVLHTSGRTERNYCSIKDAVTGILYVLIMGQSEEAYNVANEDTLISIKDMAGLVASLDGNSITKVVFDLQDIKKFGYNPEVKLKLLTGKLESLGWKPTTDLPTIFSGVIQSMKHSRVKQDEQ
ncbi:NAD-dependent epimerase/dehydratase family protein [Streptococcus acidominimus]|uniref:NAD-dependent epimerase/dehydratase family protein n=1 Tax=Streptococcus acidominimus TaxID=1326 RepID=A0A4Y9FNC5_STRAI|nr:NAD-dependent epimerase/dehydratase family protein [Streptococcus acidominimus]MBF0819538.1 NAD-dependent epimerase/dehydratase family protein [Streptococcus acidominimus]MBF0838873.1 NAD-dependent epimerase/dehydratase family protein [Streptococcus acidominimus]MBF0847579.1 NAD-dependent epimerase/dehydratase family protein [Streptococcus danieliae]TFU29748.1 NAD-dependent epimerase/dehydratase family protein [Streptococcus acidominimus]